MISGNAVIAGNGTIAPSAQFKLTIQITGNGTTSPTTGEHTYDINEYVPVTAYPSGGWQLYNWTLDSVNVGSSNPYTVYMNNNHTLAAVFTEIPPPETRYARDDNHTINGLTAGNLGTSQTSTGNGQGIGGYDYYAGAFYWAWDIIKRTSGGGETVLGDKVALVSRDSNGEGIQSNNWNCPEIALETTDAIRIICYISPDGANWTALGDWITEQLGATKLNMATWTFYTYTGAFFDPNGCGGWASWGTSSYNTRIEGFTKS